MNRFTIVVLQCLFYAISSHVSQWSYQDQENWPTACIDGYLQSPIPIYNEDTIILKNVPKLEFNNKYSVEYNANITNDGHSVKISFEKLQNRPSVSGGRLANSYFLDSFHFHWGAEHIIDEHRYPLEGHFVHYAKKYGNLQHAVNFTDGVLVLAVFYELFPYENRIFSNLITKVEDISHHINRPKKLKGTVNIFDFLPPDFTEYYQYEGSLTTPGCNEVVTWIVFSQPSFIGNYQLQLFEAVFDNRHHLIDANYREEQEVNDREIFFIMVCCQVHLNLKDMLHAELQLQPPADETPDKDGRKMLSYFQVPESIKQYFDKNSSNENATNYSLEVRNQKKHVKNIFLIIFGIILALLIISSIIVASLVNSDNSSTSDLTTTIGPLTLVSRKKWQAKPQNRDISNLTLPVNLVIISETDTTNCSSTESCSLLMREIQNKDMTSKEDIVYNFLVGGDRKIYEGRGWYLQGAASDEYNDKSIQIAFIGTFQTANQDKSQLHACSSLVNKGIELGFIGKKIKFLVQKRIQATILFEEISSWDDWIRKFFPAVL